MHNRLELVCRHDALILGLFDFGLVEVFKYTTSRLACLILSAARLFLPNLPVACHVVLLIILVFFDTLYH